jgi:predicted RNase H-like nuclease
VELVDLPALLRSQPKRLAVLAIDIPIGLLDGPRACDLAARRLLGRVRGCSVFPAACRSSLQAKEHRRACEINLQRSGRGLSRQAWCIGPKIKAVDDAISPGAQKWAFEVHPEVSFYGMNNYRPMAHRKKGREGQAERLALLVSAFPAIKEHVLRRPRHVGVDDLLDAAAAAWSALPREDGLAARFYILFRIPLIWLLRERTNAKPKNARIKIGKTRIIHISDGLHGPGWLPGLGMVGICTRINMASINVITESQLGQNLGGGTQARGIGERRWARGQWSLRCRSTIPRSPLHLRDTDSPSKLRRFLIGTPWRPPSCAEFGTKAFSGCKRVGNSAGRWFKRLAPSSAPIQCPTASSSGLSPLKAAPSRSNGFSPI